MAWRLVHLGVVGFVVLGLCATEGLGGGGAKSLVGNYIVKGKMPDGEGYEGTAEIAFEAGNTVKVTYRFGKRTEIGLGSVQGDMLTVKFQAVKNTARTGDAKYTIQDNGVLKGTWHYKDEKRMPETLIPEKKKKKN